jgi:hypothetical protein
MPPQEQRERNCGGRAGTRATTETGGQARETISYRIRDYPGRLTPPSRRLNGSKRGAFQTDARSGATTYTYDGKSRLTGESSIRNGGYALSYAYDNAGNPTSYSGIGVTWGPEGKPTLFGSSLMAAGYRVENAGE